MTIQDMEFAQNFTENIKPKMYLIAHARIFFAEFLFKARPYRDFLVFPPILIPATTDQLSKNRRPRTDSF